MTTTIGSLDLTSANSLYNDATQYFWFESDSTATYGAGVHITLSPSATFMSNPTGQNILINTDGISIRNGLLPMMTLDNNSLDFNVIDTENGTFITTATFSATSAQIGQSTKAHSVIDTSGQRFYGSNGTTLLANIGYGEGQGESGVLSIAPYYTFGTRKSNSIIGNYSLAAGLAVTASGGFSQAFGDLTTASGAFSHAEGISTIADNSGSHAEGRETTAHGQYSHAEGYKTKANGQYGHAEGYLTTVHTDAGMGAHAEGWGCYVNSAGACGHAGGRSSSVYGPIGFAHGWQVTSHGLCQTVFGQWNVLDTVSDEDEHGTYAFIIGNGSSASARSNGFAVGWDGQLYANNKQLDYIIETGSSSPWKWAKYASGRIECWGEKSWSNVACTTSAGGGYRSDDQSQSLPTGLFTAIDVCQATMKGSGGSGYTMTLRTLCTTTTISQMFWNTSKATKSTCTVDYYIIGT